MKEWNHNFHYHSFILKHLPQPCTRVLDVGCGEGALLRLLAKNCGGVIGIDPDPASLQKAAEQISSNVALIQTDLLHAPLVPESFDAITCVAALHHLPLAAAPDQFATLLKPGGKLLLIGLYRPVTPKDFLYSLAGFIYTRLLRPFKNYRENQAPQLQPLQTLADIRAAFPGARIRRRLLFRYTLVWTKN